MPLSDVRLPTAVRACAAGSAAGPTSRRGERWAGAHAAGTTMVALLAAALPAVALTGCNQLEPAAVTQPTTNPAELYMRLTLNHTAVNLTNNPADPAANTLQLVATPYDGTGAVISDAPAPVFGTSDTAIVSVTPDGLVRGRTASASVATIVATLVIDGVRRSDTAIVKVHDLVTAPVLDTLSLQVPPDSAVWYKNTVDGFGLVASFLGLIPPLTLAPRAVDGAGQPIPDLTIHYASRSRGGATVDRQSGTVVAIAPGYVRVVARTMAFGVARADSITYTVQAAFVEPIVADSQGFNAQDKSFKVQPATVTIAAGGWVFWTKSNRFLAAPTNDVTFDDPSNVTTPPAAFCDALTDLVGFPPGPYCGVGNIPSLTDGGLPFRFRQFPVPGVYPFRSTATGATGTVVVLEPTPPPP